MVVLTVDKVSKKFTTPFGVAEILINISFVLKQGEIIGLRGENGAGKTTLLNIIAGVDDDYTGNINFGKSNNLNESLGVVFQNYNSTLLPWLNVKDNICIPLKINGLAKFERENKLKEVIARLKIQSIPLTNYPHQLSGGQKQKVSIARALIQEPDILLLDEPFSSLDFQTCLDLHDTIQEIQSYKKTAILIVSHNLDHLLYLADKVIIFGGHPSAIISELEIDLPRPRVRSMLISKKFEYFRNTILNAEYVNFQRNKI